MSAVRVGGPFTVERFLGSARLIYYGFFHFVIIRRIIEVIAFFFYFKTFDLLIDFLIKRKFFSLIGVCAFFISSGCNGKYSSCSRDNGYYQYCQNPFFCAFHSLNLPARYGVIISLQGYYGVFFCKILCYNYLQLS